jgi:hypothetical protein
VFPNTVGSSAANGNVPNLTAGQNVSNPVTAYALIT